MELCFSDRGIEGIPLAAAALVQDMTVDPGHADVFAPISS